MRPRAGTMLGLTLLLGALSAAACNSDLACPQSDLVVVNLTVLDGAGEGVPGLKIVDSVPRTSAVFTVVRQLRYTPTEYTVFSSDYIDKIRASGETLIVRGSDGTRSFNTAIGVRVQGCGLLKTSGPDTVLIN